jgi:hypothetical protein
MGQWNPNGGLAGGSTAGALGGSATRTIPHPPHITVNVSGVIGDKSEVARVVNEEIARNNFYNRGNTQLQ